MHEGAMALVDFPIGESGLLKVPVYVRGVDEGGEAEFLDPFEKDGEAVVGPGFSVEAEPVSIEAPGQVGVGTEPAGVGHFLETDTETGEGRVGLPETLGAPEIGQAGVDPHACSSPDEEGLRAGKGLRKGDDGFALPLVHCRIVWIVSFFLCIVPLANASFPWLPTN